MIFRKILLTVFNAGTFLVLGFLVYNGLLELLWKLDHTKITLLILPIYILTTIAVQFDIIKKKSFIYDISTLLPLLGLIGTLAGALLIFSVFGQSNFNSIADLKNVIPGFTQGIYTALYPSLMGTLGMTLLRVQMLILGKPESE